MRFLTSLIISPPLFLLSISPSNRYFPYIWFLYSFSTYIAFSFSSIIGSDTKLNIVGSVADLQRGSGLKGIEHLLINLANGDNSFFLFI